MSQTFKCQLSVMFVMTALLGNVVRAQDDAAATAADESVTSTLTEKLKVNVGAGLRSSARFGQHEAGGGDDWSKDFNLDNIRLYFGGELLDFIGFELNADINNAQGFEDADSGFEESGEFRVLDAVLKFDLHDLLNVWVGRFLPPSDRANLSGPYYTTPWDFPFVQFGYPNIFQGRDDGAAIWGQLSKEQLEVAQLKWQFGVFEGATDRGARGGFEDPNTDDNLLYTGRVVLNLLDPETGYYNSSTYYGDMDVLALGFAAMGQEDAAGLGEPTAGGAADTENFFVMSVDLLFEKKLTSELVGDMSGVTDGVVTLDAAYYDFDDDDSHTVDTGGLFTPVTRAGQSYYLTAAYLIPWEAGVGPMKGRFQPYFRYQNYHRSGGTHGLSTTNGSTEEGFDIGVNYVMSGHNAKIAAAYQRRDLGPHTNKLDQFLVGFQVQF